MLIELESNDIISIFHKIGNDKQHCPCCYINKNQIVSINCFIYEEQQIYRIFMSDGSIYIIKINTEEHVFKNQDDYINNVVYIRKSLGIITAKRSTTPT